MIGAWVPRGASAAPRRTAAAVVPVRRMGLALLTMACLGSGMPALAEVTVRDDRGVTVRLAQPPQRIVSLLPSLTETVCALGACDRLVGTDRYSNWPEAVLRVPKLGGMEDAQVERIVALKPDVVLASQSTRAVERLEALGLKVVATEAKDQKSARATLMLVARLLDRGAQAAQVQARIDAEVQRAAARVPARLRGRQVYFEVSDSPHAAGASSFVGETLALLGLGNVVPPSMGPFPKLNPEFVVRARPDIVMGVQRNVANMAGRPGWDRLSALQHQQVCAYEGARYDLLIRPGPRLGEGALALAECLAHLPVVPAVVRAEASGPGRGPEFSR